METMKPKIIDKEVPTDQLTYGYYFHPPSDQSTYYLIHVVNIRKGINCLVSVETMSIPQENANEVICENGEYIGMDVLEVNQCFDISIWEKYYFPTFHADHPDHNYQWYHEDEKYPSNTMKGFYEVMQFAYDLGIKMAEIKSI